MIRWWGFGVIVGIIVLGGWLASLEQRVGAEDMRGGEAVTTVRLSLWGTEEGNGASVDGDISGEGRWVVFSSSATNWQSGLTHTPQIYLYDRLTQRTEFLSPGEGGAMPNGKSQSAVISADGSVVAFQSLASNLVAGDTNGRADIFVVDRATLQMERLSLRGDGTEAQWDAVAPALSSDGQYVVFEAQDDLLPNDQNGASDIYIKERQSGELHLVSVGITGVAGDGESYFPAISEDGQWVTFVSNANDLVLNDSGDYYELFLYNRILRQTRRLSFGWNGGPIQNGNCSYSDISHGGEWVVAVCDANNIVPNDTNAVSDVFLFDTLTNEIQRISINADGVQANGQSWNPDIAPTGEAVAFVSGADNIIPDDTNAASDVFVWQRSTDTLTRVSLAADGSENLAGSGGVGLSIYGDVLFFTPGVLTAGDTNGTNDVHLRGAVWLSRQLYLPLTKKE